MNHPLVSIITYCFNGERFVHKYFEAILAQTYPNIELIFFNNGSTDRTGEIAEAYREKLTSRGIRTKIIHYEENQSTCRLKQEGISLMQGEYFCGCDSDDLMDPDYIQEMAGYLIAHPEKGIVFCQLRMIREDDGKLLRISKVIPRNGEKEAFLDMLYARNCMFTAISYMMSRAHFIRINPEKKIYISRFGENYQLQLPFLYHDLQGYIEKPLGNYTVRSDSYTGKMVRDPAKQVEAYKGQEESIVATLRQIDPEMDGAYALIAKRRLRRDRFYASLWIEDPALQKSCYRDLLDVNGVSWKERIISVVPGLYRKLKTWNRKGELAK